MHISKGQVVGFYISRWFFKIINATTTSTLMYLKDGEGGVHFSQKTMLVHLATNSDNDDDEEGDEDDAPSIN